jgi:NADH:ubiquinone oxidoreductase subunit D
MRFEDLGTATPPMFTRDRDEILAYCLAAVTDREIFTSYLRVGDGGASGDAAKADTLQLKAFFDALSTRLAAVAATQDAEV